jgi:hypothetical protein
MLLLRNFGKLEKSLSDKFKLGLSEAHSCAR